MEEVLEAGKRERTPSRLGYRSGYYHRSPTTRVGKIELKVLQERQGRFRTEVFERYQRSEKALASATIEMYVAGVSTRKLKAITEELRGQEFSSASISRMVQRLDYPTRERLSRVAGGAFSDRQQPTLALNDVRTNAKRIAVHSAEARKALGGELSRDDIG
jgi:transposase-like protein